MIIQALKEPFPHLIIDEVYDNSELDLIWKEIDSVTSPYKMIPSELSGSYGKDPKTNLAIASSLSYDFKDNDNSQILSIIKKIQNHKDISNTFKSLTPLNNHVDIINFCGVKLKYYEDNSYHTSHIDSARFTVLTYFYKEPKSFDGGDLYFEEYNYIIPIKNNRSVFFNGAVKHGSSTTKMNDNKGYFTGFGKYTITQFYDYYDYIDKNIPPLFNTTR